MNIVQHLFQSSAELYMPTKKRRVGFIPNYDVLALINKLSYENNLSHSKIINILVEEALYKRGLLNRESGRLSIKTNQENIEVVNRGFRYKFKNKLLNVENSDNKEDIEEILDNEIYNKFLMFLQFQEKMKNRD